MAKSQKAKQYNQAPTTLTVRHTHCFVGDKATDIELSIDLKTMRLGTMYLAGGKELSTGEQADVMESLQQNDDWREWFEGEDPRVVEAIVNSLKDERKSHKSDED